ncbi:MAG: 50S ribosomal protein L25 [Actinomycetota bacterium]
MADTMLTAERRDALGKGGAGRVRRDGRVPAVVYGLGGESIPVSVGARELSRLLAGPSGVNTLITLSLDGTEELALARQIQRNPLKGSITHVDFIRVRADQTVEADVPLHLVGDAEGVSRGGVLEQSLHQLLVEARPSDVPTSIEIDVTALMIGDSVHVRDLAVPAGVTVLQDPDALVAVISAPRVAREAGVGEAAEGESAGEG